jgi:Ulp1 family protease
MLKTLKPRQWLRDDVVNAYINLLRERSSVMGDSVWIATSPFWPKVTADVKDQATGQVQSHGYNYAGVQTWSAVTIRTKPRPQPVDLLSKTLLLFPINYVQSHWAAMALDLVNKRAIYYDSLAGSQRSALDKANAAASVLLRWLRDEAKTKKGIDMDTSDWSIIGAYGTLPQQHNGCDCGVFMCLFLDYLSAGYTPVEGSPEKGADFDQSDIDNFRIRMGCCLLEQRLIEVPWEKLTEKGLGPKTPGAK